MLRPQCYPDMPLESLVRHFPCERHQMKHTFQTRSKYALYGLWVVGSATILD